jgi:signal peptide peptidase SppA
MNFAPHIAARVLNVPLMIMPEKLAAISAVLESRIGIDADSLQQMAALAPQAPQGSPYIGDYDVNPNDPRGGRKPYRTTQNGIAIVPIIGSLVNRGSFLDVLSGICSYEKTKFLLASAAADPDVRAIVLDIDSPGGEAIGAFETAEAVRSAAKIKTVVATANGLCCSAAYAIASAATRVVISPSAMMGSVGVVLLHVDHSRRIDKAGLTPSLIHAGARKVDGHPYAPLDEAVRGELQSEVDRFMDLFVAGVAKGRSGMTPATIRGTDARVYLGADAVKIGFADEVGTLESVVSAYLAIYPNRSRIAPARTAQIAERRAVRSL